MIEEFSEDFDCWKWLKAGKEDMLRSLRRKKAANGHRQQPRRHYNYNKNRAKIAAPTKLSNKAFEEILNLQPLNLFLHLATENEPDFFVNQIDPNDDMERVLIYTRILVTLCDLELPGFHHDMLRKVASCTPLLEHYEEIVRKLCTKSYRTMWSDLERVDKIICYMQTLLLPAQRANVMDKTAMQILFNIWMYLKNNSNPTVAERPVCMQFLQRLNSVFSVDQEILNEPCPPVEIYPSLEELRQWLTNSMHGCPEAPKSKASYINSTQYINNQLLLLRHQFVTPLRKLVMTLHQHRNMKDIKSLHIAFERVQIKRNRNYNDVHHTKLLYIKLLAGKDGRLDEADAAACSKLKSGTLLCLSTSYDFDNLILAIVCSTDTNALNSGYISISILQQYNIGNIYKKMLIMFEAPDYFEPYYKTYRYLINSNVLSFPMSDFIVHGISRTEPPLYLQHTQLPNVYKSQKFKTKLTKMPLNVSQRNALERVITTNFNLIQGPPGTGKTHLSLQLVKTILENAKHCAPIVVIAYTNDSLDKFLLKLSAYTSSIVRFGNQSKTPEICKFNAHSDTNMRMINPKLKRLYWMVKMELKEHFQRLQLLYAASNESDDGYTDILKTQRRFWNAKEKLDSIRIIFQHYLIVKKNVLAMTTSCAARMSFVFRFLKSRVVFFEEAAEILEAHILPCLTPYTEQVIMIGDHMQLKPWSTYIPGIRHSSFSQSLFERLISANFHVNVLNIQYRMRNDFVDLLCPLIYKKLFSHQSVQQFLSVRKMTKNLYFFDHRNFETMKNITSPTNAYEKRKVYGIVRHLVEVSGYNTNEIVVLTPYINQMAIIKEEFSKHLNLRGIRVSTVDSFQGLEADIVVLSLVRSNAERKIGFLFEPNRICVALSRARYGLYIIGNMEALADNSVTWREIRKRLIIQNAIGNKFPTNT